MIEPGSSELWVSRFRSCSGKVQAICSGSSAQIVGTLRVSSRVRCPQQKEAHLMSVRRRTPVNVDLSVSPLSSSLSISISRPDLKDNDNYLILPTNGSSGNSPYPSYPASRIQLQYPLFYSLNNTSIHTKPTMREEPQHM